MHALPAGWKSAQIKDFSEVVQGGRLGLTKQDHYRSSGVPAYSAAGQDGFVDRVEFADTNAVILSAIGANCGRCFYAEGSWATLANVQAIIPNEGIANAKFVFFRVNRDDYWPKSGSAQPFIKPSEIKSCWVSLPPVREQSAIARILDTLDTQIEKTQALIAKLEQVKEGLLHDLLTRGVDENGELRPSAEEAPQLYKESALGLIPREWSLRRLEDVAPLDRSVLRTGPFGSSLKGEHWRETGRPVITIGSLGNNRFIQEELLFIDERTATALADFALRSGDIVFSRVADVGRSVVVTEAEEQWIMSSNFMRISINGQTIRPRFLQLLLACSAAIRSQLLATVNSAGRDVVNSGILMKLRFITPPPIEQDRIIEKVETAENRIAHESSTLRKLSAEKSGLMDDLLTGHVRVTPLLDREPVEAT